MTKSEDKREVSGPEIDFKDFVENLPVGIYQVDNDGKFVYCNDVMARILGFSGCGGLIGKDIKDFYVHPEDRDRLIEKMRTEGGTFVDETLHWKTRQNKEIYLSDSCRFIHDRKGKKIGVRGVLVEVWYRKVFDEMNEGIYKIGEDLETIVRVNHAVARMFGYKCPEEIEGLNIKRFYKNPADLEKLKAKLRKDGEVVNYPIEMVKKSGEEFVISINASLVKDEAGNITGREVIYRDITESHKIRNILEDMPTGAYQVKKTGERNLISYCNKAFAYMFDISSPKDVEGTEIRRLYANDTNVQKFEDALISADAKGSPLFDYRLQVKKDNGERFWIEIDCQLLKDHKGDIIGRQGTVRDATDKIQLQKMAGQIEEMVGRKNEIQRFFHRFMAPIMSIKSSSDTLIEEMKRLMEGELFGDSREIYKKVHGNPIEMLKGIYNLSRKLLENLTNLIELVEQEKKNGSGDFKYQMKQFETQLEILSNKRRIENIIDLREIHRNINSYLMQHFFTNMFIKDEINNILDRLEDLDKFYILFITQIITNTAKIAHTDVENLRSYLLGWDKKKNEQSYEYRKENLYDCIKEVAGIYQIYAFEKGIAIEILADPFLEIDMSKEDFKKMLHNLIQNAVKYSYKKIRNIRLRVQNNVSDVEIEITNYGVGILPAEIEEGKIFETGYRGKLSYDWNRTGSGIGLSESQKIAGKHGGKIAVFSRPVGERKDDPKSPFVTRVEVTLPKFH